MEVTPAQRRTRDLLIGLGPVAPFEADVGDLVRADLEARLARAGILPGGDPIWLGKHRLTDRERCQGLFQAGILREGPGFQHTPRTAAGALLHKAIEVDVATQRQFDPATVCWRAALRCADGDGSFGRLWQGLDAIDQAEIVADAGRHLALFRDSFPPLPRRWAPQPELGLKVNVAGGAVVLSGTPDLVLGRSRRLILDFKTGQARAEHPEDMRFYALLMLLRTGVPPYRVATFFLDSGEWQSEDVDRQMLDRATDRVAAAAVAAHRLRSGGSAPLTPGAFCAWCPRRSSCAALAQDSDAADGESSVPADLLPDGRLSCGATIPWAPTSRVGATIRRESDGKPVSGGPDPSPGRGPPQDARPGHPARAIR